MGFKPQGKLKDYSGRRKLTAKQELFLEEYGRDFDIVGSMRRAGYTPTSIQQRHGTLLANPVVASKMREHELEIAHRAGLEPQWVINRLQEVADRCMQAVEVPEHAGRKGGLFKFDSAGALRALELLGKTLGIFNDRLQVDVKGVHERCLDELDAAITVSVIDKAVVESLPEPEPEPAEDVPILNRRAEGRHNE